MNSRRTDEPPVTALTFHMRIPHTADRPQQWWATLESHRGAEAALAAVVGATLLRVLFRDAWFDLLGPVCPDAAAAAQALLDRAANSDPPRRPTSPEALTVVSRLEVSGEDRTRTLSRDLVRSVAGVFRNDVIALAPVSRGGTGHSSPADHELEDEMDRRWLEMGFITVPGFSTLMLLPPEGRPTS